MLLGVESHSWGSSASFLRGYGTLRRVKGVDVVIVVVVVVAVVVEPEINQVLVAVSRLDFCGRLVSRRYVHEVKSEKLPSLKVVALNRVGLPQPRC